MTATTLSTPRRGELAKLGAFIRRDFMIQWSYRMAFAMDIVRLATEVLVFSFVSKLVDPSTMPSFGGTRASYMGFVVAGIAVSAFIFLGLSRATRALRTEQLAGTLEPLFMTPTSPWMIQLGLVVYDLAYVPVRTTLFLVLVTAWTGVHLEFEQLLPALAIIVSLAPFIWGIGVAGAGTVLTFRRGNGAVGFFGAFVTLGSGAYFPIELLPGWMQPAARNNPVGIAMQGVRDALLGGEGWSQALPRVAVILPIGVAAMAVGMVVFHLALQRERRLGTLNQY